MKKKILEIRKKINNYSKFISEYGFNKEKDIFIIEDISRILKDLDELEKKLKNEK